MNKQVFLYLFCCILFLPSCFEDVNDLPENEYENFSDPFITFTGYDQDPGWILTVDYEINVRIPTDQGIKGLAVFRDNQRIFVITDFNQGYFIVQDFSPVDDACFRMAFITHEDEYVHYSNPLCL